MEHQTLYSLEQRSIKLKNSNKSAKITTTKKERRQKQVLALWVTLSYQPVHALVHVVGMILSNEMIQDFTTYTSPKPENRKYVSNIVIYRRDLQY